ncbi:hypothetical protein ACC791_36850, partial [Rhizobium ruizarguesonis]
METDDLTKVWSVTEFCSRHRKILGWTSPPFEIPEALLNDWRKIGAKGGPARMAWEVRVQT